MNNVALLACELCLDDPVWSFPNWKLDEIPEEIPPDEDWSTTWDDELEDLAARYPFELCSQFPPLHDFIVTSYVLPRDLGVEAPF